LDEAHNIGVVGKIGRAKGCLWALGCGYYWYWYYDGDIHQIIRIMWRLYFKI